MRYITVKDRIELRLISLFGDNPTEDSIYNDIYDEYETTYKNDSSGF